jgi:hypothetical protein
MKYAVTAALLLAAPMAYAQDAVPLAAPAAAPLQPIVATPRAVTPGATATLPSNTEVLVSMNSEISSKKVREGSTFTLSVSRDVILNNYVVVPKGTSAHGVVTWRTGKGAFGKSAKMEFEVRHLELNGRQVPLVGHFRQEGSGNTGATVGTAIAVGVFSAFVTGRSAVVEQGREFRVFTRDPLDVVLPQAPLTTPPVLTTVSATNS